MPNINVAVIGSPGYASDLGKRGTSTDITFYNLKDGEDTVTFIEPTKYPERLAPLFFSASMSRKALLVVDELTPAFGESVLALQCLGLEEGFMVIRNFIAPEKILPLIKGTVAEGYEVFRDDKMALRKRLLQDAAAQEVAGAPSAGTVVVDHSFNVKGVGAVVLGTVADGIIRRHDEMRAMPGGKTAQVRSIQKHDDDFDTAVAGDRVGLALRDVEVDDLERGTVLTTDPRMASTREITGSARLVKYWPSQLKEGMALHFGHWMQFIPARVEAVGDRGDWRRPSLKMALDSELVYLPGGSATMTYLAGGKLRVAGVLPLP